MSSELLDGVFVWTEAYNCGEVLNPMLNSYVTHHNIPINVYATSDDLKKIENLSPLITYHDLSTKRPNESIEKRILNGYKKGHKGTAELWSYILRTRSERFFLHLDSDTIFLRNSIIDLLQAVKYCGYSLAGSRRPYFNRSYRKSGRDGKALDQLPDVVNTDCFIFDKELINIWPSFWLKRKILGRRVSKNPVIDFFDPVSFEIIKNGGKVLYIDSPADGNRAFSKKESEFHQSRISFAAVGSGLNFYKNAEVKTSPGYKQFAISSYSLFAKYLLNQDIGVTPLNEPDLVKKLERLNQKKWILENND